MLKLLRRIRRPDQGPPVEAHPDPFATFPEGVRVLAIGDIHGRADLLAALLKHFDEHETRAEPARTIIVTLGDVIDRGPYSRAVLDLLIERAERQEVKAVLGNHEAMLLRFLSEPWSLAEWMRFGGLETLKSYGVTPTPPLDPASMARTAAEAGERIPKDHLAFVRSMRLAWTCGDMTFVHAGLRPGRSLDQQEDRDLLEIRQPFLGHEGWFGTYVVHGHTPVSDLEMRPNRLNLDTGAFATGKLTGAIISRNSLLRLTVRAPSESRPSGGGGA